MRVCSFPSEPYDIKECPETSGDHMGRVAPSRFSVGRSIYPSAPRQLLDPRVALGPTICLRAVVAGRIPTWAIGQSTKGPRVPPCQPHHHPPEGPSPAAAPPPPTLPVHIPSLTLDTMALSAVFKRVLFIAAVALAAVSDVEATRVMTRPKNFNGTATNHAVTKRASSGKVNAAYFTNWYVLPLGLSVSAFR